MPPRCSIRYGISCRRIRWSPDGAAIADDRDGPTRESAVAAQTIRVNVDLLENLIKECGEEAGIPPELARNAKAVGYISYWNQSGRQLKPDIMTCFDLELPENFTPHAADGEVRVDLQQVAIRGRGHRRAAHFASQ